MGDFRIYVALLVLALVFLGAVLWRRWSARWHEAQRERAIREFDEHRDELAAKFLPAAAAGGKPRGLWWRSCEFSGSPLFAVGDNGRTLYALVAVTISFEAIEGGGMEEVEAVGNLRSATAVFVHRDGAWTTDGRVIFNLEPAEALRRFEGTLRAIGER